MKPTPEQQLDPPDYEAEEIQANHKKWRDDHCEWGDTADDDNVHVGD